MKTKCISLRTDRISTEGPFGSDTPEAVLPPRKSTVMFGMWLDSVPQRSPTGDLEFGAVIRGSSRKAVMEEE